MDREEGGRYQRSAAFKVVGHFCSFYKTANKNEQLWPHGKESNFEHLSLPPPSASLSLPPQAADERDTRLDPGAAPALLPDGGSEVSPEQGETSRG